jgi:LPXTG-site transpeptidase (sortase) family protein
MYRPWAKNMALPDPVGDWDPTTAQQDYQDFQGDEVAPVRLIIDKIGINEAITPVGVDSNDYMLAPEDVLGITWYRRGASPGWEGNAIFSGHNYIKGVPGTFVNLHELMVGDIARVQYENGFEASFEVKSVLTYYKDDVPAHVMQQAGATRMTLITCGGTRYPVGGYSHRVIATLTMVEADSGELR